MKGMSVAFTTSLNQEEFTRWRDFKHGNRKVQGSGEEPRVLFQKAGSQLCCSQAWLIWSLSCRRTLGCPQPPAYFNSLVARQNMDSRSRHGERDVSM